MYIYLLPAHLQMVLLIIILSSYLVIRIFQMVLINLRKTFKWSNHICNTQNTNIQSHNYFSVLVSNLESKFDETSADDMVKEFINSLISVGKEIKAFFPLKI
jgi:hypothetical protein